MELTNCDFNINNIRVIQSDGEPWFVASDALNAMGYARGNHSMIRQKLDDSEKAINRIATLGGPQITSMISESGLYKLIMQSDKPEAREFQDWITDAVMPAISKDGIGVAVVSY